MWVSQHLVDLLPRGCAGGQLLRWLHSQTSPTTGSQPPCKRRGAHAPPSLQSTAMNPHCRYFWGKKEVQPRTSEFAGHTFTTANAFKCFKHLSTSLWDTVRESGTAAKSVTNPSGLLHHVTLGAVQRISKFVAELWTQKLLNHRLLWADGCRWIRWVAQGVG